MLASGGEVNTNNDSIKSSTNVVLLWKLHLYKPNVNDFNLENDSNTYSD